MAQGSDLGHGTLDLAHSHAASAAFSHGRLWLQVLLCAAADTSTGCGRSPCAAAKRSAGCDWVLAPALDPEWIVLAHSQTWLPIPDLEDAWETPKKKYTSRFC